MGRKFTVPAGLDTPPSTITNYCSAGGVSIAQIDTALNSRLVTSGALSANVLAAMVNQSGAGVLDVCYLVNADATARTIRLVVALDGAVAFDAVSNSIAATGAGLVAVGHMGTFSVSSRPVTPQPIPFNRSCVIWIASSLTETSKQLLYYTMRVF